jgi:hypothetical protein
MNSYLYARPDGTIAMHEYAWRRGTIAMHETWIATNDLSQSQASIPTSLIHRMNNMSGYQLPMTTMMVMTATTAMMMMAATTTAWVTAVKKEVTTWMMTSNMR